MKTITRRVSLEPLITRYPVCYPSIKDGFINYLSSDTLGAINNAHYACIPLGVNKDITGDYSAFTDEMGVAYSGRTIFCYTLQKWMVEFEQYYDMLRSDECHGEFDSAVDYYARTYPDAYTYEEAKEFDENIKRHGGSKFYKWLIDNYFIMLDLKSEYSAVSGSCSYSEWCGYIDNIGSDRIPFPAAVNFLGKLSRMHELYSGLDCQNNDDCCECVDYNLIGGDIMFGCVSSWMSRVRSNITKNDRKISNFSDEYRKPLIPKTYINFLMTEKIEDLGFLVSFSQEFKPGHTYVKDEICDYDDITYIMVNENAYNKTYFVTEENKVKYWEEYYNVYIKEHKDEKDVGGLSALSGRTVSSLDFFMRNVDTVDGIGNVLPGYFKPNTQSHFVQPAENSLLDFMYQPGTYNNIEKFSNDNNEKLYKCDFLDRITFFYKDLNENIIDDSIVIAESGDNVNQKILSCKESVSGTTNTGIIYADFHYYKDSVVTISSGDVTSGYTITRKDGYNGEIEFTDHCTVEEAVCQYHISDTESYPLRYYKVNMDMETHFSDEYQKYVNVYMCDFVRNASESFEKKNNAKPFLRMEELLPFVNAETPVDNIYIDRGYATALDRHLRIGEISNYEQLEKYGNGMFQIFNADEDVT